MRNRAPDTAIAAVAPHPRRLRIRAEAAKQTTVQFAWVVVNRFVHPDHVRGGLPIVIEDQLIGSIGVGGASGDEPCAYEALTKVLGPQPALAPTLPAPATK